MPKPWNIEIEDHIAPSLYQLICDVYQRKYQLTEAQSQAFDALLKAFKIHYEFTDEDIGRLNFILSDYSYSCDSEDLAKVMKPVLRKFMLFSMYQKNCTAEDIKFYTTPDATGHFPPLTEEDLFNFIAEPLGLSMTIKKIC